MSGQVRQFGVQLAAEAFDKFPDRISYVGHQGITRGQHDPVRIIRRERKRSMALEWGYDQSLRVIAVLTNASGELEMAT